MSASTQIPTTSVPKASMPIYSSNSTYTQARQVAGGPLQEKRAPYQNEQIYDYILKVKITEFKFLKMVVGVNE